MTDTVTQQNFPNPELPGQVFASDPASVIEKPGTTDYANGVEVGYTAPAKWWNWLWNHISNWLLSSKNDREALFSEITNTVTDSGVVPDSSDSQQLAKAIRTIEARETVAYDNREITEEIDGVNVTHKVNQPYVVGHTLYVPDTELL